MTLDAAQLIAIFLLVADLEIVITCLINLNFGFSFANVAISLSLACTVTFVAYVFFGGGMCDLISILPANKTQLLQSPFIKNCSLLQSCGDL